MSCRQWCLCYAILAAFFVAIFGSELRAEIDGPETFKQNRMGRYKAAASGPAQFAWRAYPQGKLEMEVLDNGERLLIVGPPGEYSLEQIEAKLTDDGKLSGITWHSKSIVIEPEKPDPPKPPDDPVKPLPDGKYKLAQWAYDHAKTLPNRVAVGKGIRSILDDTSITDPNGLIERTLTSINFNGGPDWQPWRRAWADELERLGFLKLPLSEWRIGWAETCNGLEAK